MFKTMAALRHAVLEYPRALAILLQAISQPVVPFALIGAFFAVAKRATDRLLLLFYCVAAWLMAILIDPQAGGSINYFWEPLIASAVLAGPGLCELESKADRTRPRLKQCSLSCCCGRLCPCCGTNSRISRYVARISANIMRARRGGSRSYPRCPGEDCYRPIPTWHFSVAPRRSLIPF